MDIFAVENRHTSGVYAKHPLAILKGQGASLWDSTGREYIDCMGGHGVANLGHSTLRWRRPSPSRLAH
jgi:acetylornithine/LysW-gamma-L-lysine aminotransferase